jgi:hypothetical protein
VPSWNAPWGWSMLELQDTRALVSALLDTCVEQVLETMFFTPVLGPVEPEDGEGRERVSAALNFSGQPSGAFQVDADPRVALSLAGSFLGVEESEVTGQQVDEVMAEFSNITCGFALSNLGRVEYFHLALPETSRTIAFTPAVEGVRRSFALDLGTLSVCLSVNFHPRG